MAEYISYIYQVIDKFSTPLKKITAASYKFNDQIKRTQPALKKFGEKAKSIEGALAGVGAGAAMAFTAGKAMDFQDVMTDVDKVLTFTADNTLEGFKENVFKTAVELGKLPKNIAEIAVAGGKLGIPVDQMDKFIGVVARTSVAFDMLEGTAGEKIGSIKDKLGLTVEETGNLMDAVNFLADNTSAGGARMIEIIARTSGELKGIEMPRKFMAGWAAFSDMMETTPELAASGLNMMVRKMQQMPGMTEKLVAAPQEAISQFLGSIAKLDTVKRIEVIDQIFGPEAGRFVKKAVVNMQKFDDTMKLVMDDTKFSGSMMKELEKKLGTGKTAWSQIKAVLDIVSITIGDTLLPYIKEAAPVIVKAGLGFREWAKAHPQLVKIGLAIGAVVAVAGPLVFALGMISFAIGSISLPMVAVAAGVAAVIGGLFLLYKGIKWVIDNWKNMVAAFFDGIDWFKKEFPLLTDIIKMAFDLSPIGVFINSIKSLRDIFMAFMTDIDTGFTEIKDKFNAIKDFPAETWGKAKDIGAGLTGKVKGIFGFGDKGVAATNAGVSKNNLNGQIVVAPAKGAQVNSASMTTDVPGNLGFNIAAGVTP